MAKFERQVVVATHNEGKLAEFARLFAPWEVDVVGGDAVGLPEPEETGTTFEANALLKAREGAKKSGQVVVADDSGLEVDALRGAPGVFSARWAGEEKDFTFAMSRVHEELAKQGVQEPTPARFVCVLAVVTPQGEEQVFQGVVEGEFVWPPRGKQGFGYDPCFVARGETLTYGELGTARKAGSSHRVRAFEALAEVCFAQGGLLAR